MLHIYIAKAPDLPEEFGTSPGKYGIIVFLIKKKFDFAALSTTCKDTIVSIRSSDTLIAKKNFQDVAAGAFIFYKNSASEAFAAARSLCSEKVDPDLRY